MMGIKAVKTALEGSSFRRGPRHTGHQPVSQRLRSMGDLVGSIRRILDDVGIKPQKRQGADQIFAGATWPGTKYHGEEGGYYYWDVPEAYVGKTVSLLAVKEDQSEQTSDYTGVVLDKSVYFYLEWTSEKGCHLIQENK